MNIKVFISYDKTLISGKMKNQNNKLGYRCTIIIPTYNRPNHLRRILDYYNKYGTDFNIIVGDSSSKINKKINKKTVSLFSNLNIQYLNNYSSKINLYHKTFDALNYVNTKYTVFCADDDFITPNGINKSVDFLEKNPDFIVAQGYYLLFYLKNKNNRKKDFYWTSHLYNNQVTFPEIKSRLIFYLSNYQVLTFYGVRKTKYLKKFLKEIIKFTDGYAFSEMLLTNLGAVYGKIKCLDILYGAREIEGGKCIARKSLIDFIKEGAYNKKYVKFRECLSIHLSKKSSLTIEESKKLIDEIMPSCLKNIYKTYHQSPRVKIIKFLNKLELPSWMQEKIRQLYRELAFIKDVRMNSFWNLIDKPSSRYYYDFNNIRNHVLLHSKK